jgi:hypothetical protein
LNSIVFNSPNTLPNIVEGELIADPLILDNVNEVVDAFLTVFVATVRDGMNKQRFMKFIDCGARARTRSQKCEAVVE